MRLLLLKVDVEILNRMFRMLPTLCHVTAATRALSVSDHSNVPRAFRLTHCFQQLINEFPDNTRMLPSRKGEARSILAQC